MFDKILIANRGEIACRVMRTARRLGIKSVAVFSTADARALHVISADEAVAIGGPAPADSYLQMERLIDAAKQTGAQAIHPGYGFLSENAQFAGLCAAHDLIFIGPGRRAIETMGSKSAAKQAMGNAGVPLLPGYHGEAQSPDVLAQAAAEVGYPILLKAVAGGGGKGMRAVYEASEFVAALQAARREAQSGFGVDAMLVEKFLTRPRHVEVQVFCDQHGNGVYLFERDCSVQRRHQKVIEEAPAPGLTPELRAEMGEAALRAAQAVDYVGAGTVEFLLDEDQRFYFMEMNTRLQVEHPVTEMVTGQDLVEWQLRVAAGERLPVTQDGLRLTGHAFEARIYAEDPGNEFLPAAGHITLLREPQQDDHVRIDTGVVAGDDVGVYYDPMIAKLIVWDRDREQALRRLRAALADYAIAGVTTNVAFLQQLTGHGAFAAADLSTGFIDTHSEDLLQAVPVAQEVAVPLAALFIELKASTGYLNQVASPWVLQDHWRLNASPQWQQELLVDGEHHVVTLEALPEGLSLSYAEQRSVISGSLQDQSLQAILDGRRLNAVVAPESAGFRLFVDGRSCRFEACLPDLGDVSGAADAAGFNAPMNGAIVDVLVAADQSVDAGDTLVIMEAMKMEHAIKAPTAGRITEVFYTKGDLVEGGAALLTFVAE